METTAKNFALQLGALVALYVSLTSLVVMLFGIVNIHFPDPASAYYEYDSAESSIRFSLAILVVFFPTYLLLTRKVNKARRSAEGAYLMLTKWMIYLSLLVGGFVLLGDFVTVIYTFLNGEITTRFILKALALLVVVGSAFYYYLQDAKGYWNKNEKLSIQLGIGAGAVVLAVCIYGFYSIDSPSVVRDIAIDRNQVNDLQEIQWRIEEYYATNNQLPTSIEEVYVEGMTIPTAPEERSPYQYQMTGEDSYQLCATFARATPESEKSIARPIYDDPGYLKNQNWDHPTGNYCFDRQALAAKTVD